MFKNAWNLKNLKFQNAQNERIEFETSRILIKYCIKNSQNFKNIIFRTRQNLKKKTGIKISPSKKLAKMQNLKFIEYKLYNEKNVKIENVEFKIY